METVLDFNLSARSLKSKVTLRQVIESYGIRIEGRHICCPLHNENTPSFKVYEEDTPEGNFYCYGCQKSGDIISFVAFKENCSAGQALVKIAKNFNIELITKDNMASSLVSNLSLILTKKKKETPKEITEDLNWRILAEKVQKEFASLEQLPVTYLLNKNLPHIETKSKWDILIVPMRDIDGSIWSFQQIHADGTKMFLKDAKKNDLMLRLGPETNEFVFLCEGWATGASVYRSTGRTTYISFTASNLDSVAIQLKNKYPGIKIIVAGDNDESGRRHHQIAIYPEEYKTDWSTIYLRQGPEKVKSLLLNRSSSV